MKTRLAPLLLVALSSAACASDGSGLDYDVDKTGYVMRSPPAIVTVLVPRTATALAVSVNKVVPVVGFGEKEAVTPLGRPETERLTLPVNPYSGLT